MEEEKEYEAEPNRVEAGTDPTEVKLNSPEQRQ
jgi:hypothetical protein